MNMWRPQRLPMVIRLFVRAHSGQEFDSTLDVAVSILIYFIMSVLLASFLPPVLGMWWLWFLALDRLAWFPLWSPVSFLCFFFFEFSLFSVSISFPSWVRERAFWNQRFEIPLVDLVLWLWSWFSRPRLQKYKLHFRGVFLFPLFPTFLLFIDCCLGYSSVFKPGFLGWFWLRKADISTTRHPWLSIWPTYGT